MKRRGKLIAAYIALLTLFTSYVLMDTFFITRVYGEEADAHAEADAGEQDDALNESGESGSGQDAADQDNASGNMHGGHDGSEDGRHGGPNGGKPGHKRSGGSDDSNPGSGSGSSSGSGSGSGSSGSSRSQGASTSTTYNKDGIQITLTEYRENDTTIYAADVQISSPSYLKTALAQGSYGRNVTEKTSEMAEAAGAVLAINGDYYGAQSKGYVIRNGTLYRDTALAGQEDLVIYKDGSFGIINESEVTASQLMADGAVQVLSFGPALVENGAVAVSENEEVGQAMASNPRTAIGIIDEGHYLFVVSDGRSSESEGLSLYELAQFMKSQGVSTAYNLDGGGSSTMYFNGSVVNNPTTNGGTIRERSVSDIVYIG